MSLSSTLNAVASLIWPHRCAACHEILGEWPAGEGVPLCALCTASLMAAASPHCTRCALPFDSAGPDHLCAECLKQAPPFEGLFAAYLYGGAAAEVIRRLKYGGMTHLGPPMGREMARTVSAPARLHAVIPVPLHPKKLKARGFNQSALLARELARALKIPMDTASMARTRNTSAQAGLSREERLANLRGAFAVKRPGAVDGKRILLVDDVVTTATTVREAARALVQNGARSVEVVAFARAG